MKKRSIQPVALTIAGSDSGGGAGIQADLKTFASLGVHGTTAITCVTAQNPTRVTAIQACRPDMVRQQIEAVFAELPPAVAKTGMLYSAEIIRTVADCFKHRRATSLIVDPVMVATSGSILLKPSAIRVLRQELLPLATLVAPNLSEAAVLLGKEVSSIDQARAAAREIHSLFGCAALVKGGHLAGLTEAVDFYYDGHDELMLKAPFIRKVNTHGTGCVYSAAIAGYFVLGCNLPYAVQMAKEYVTQAIAQSISTGRHTSLNCYWE